MGDFKLTLDPADKATFTGNLGAEAATINVKLTNPLKERIVFKVKCTSNEMFRIRPPVGELKPSETVTISLIFNQGKSVPDNGKHYFAFYYLKEEKKTARAAFTEHKGEPEGMKKLFADFKKEGGGDEKKEDEKDAKKDEKKEDKKGDKKEKEKKEEKKDEKKKEDKKEEKKEEKKDEKKDEKKEADEKDDDDDKK